VDVVLTSNLVGTVQFLQSLVHDKCVGDGYILNVLCFSALKPGRVTRVGSPGSGHPGHPGQPGHILSGSSGSDPVQKLSGSDPDWIT